MIILLQFPGGLVALIDIERAFNKVKHEAAIRELQHGTYISRFIRLINSWFRIGNKRTFQIKPS